MPDTLTLSSLPLFPLATVLFPGGALPLRVFEVRYLDMINKCHKAGAPFGVVTLTGGEEVRRPGARAETFHGVGTLARIQALVPVQSGLLLVHCQGEQRFRVTRSQQLRHGLWTADVDCLPGDLPVPVPADLRAVARALDNVRDTLLARQGFEPGERPAAASAPRDDAGWLANRWCELLPVPLETKQHLMALDNPLVRLELVADMLGRLGILA